MACGMEIAVDDASSLAMTTPPKWWMAVAPVAPSIPWPDKMTAIAREPTASARVVSSRSADGRYGGAGPNSMSATAPCGVIRVCCPEGRYQHVDGY